MLASSGYLARVDPDLCAGCGLCQERCQFEAITVDSGLCQVAAEKCMGCGACTGACPQGAMALVPHPAGGIPFELDQLLNSVVQPITRD